MATFADIHGYITFPAGVAPSKVFDVFAGDSRFKVSESDAHESFQRSYVSVAGEARLSGPSDDLTWVTTIESRLKEIEFFSLVLFVSYEDAPTLSISYFKIGDIRKSVGRLSEQALSQDRI